MNQPNKTEQKILDILRSLQPFERIVIEADKSGNPESYIVQRSVRVILDPLKTSPQRHSPPVQNV